MDLFKMRQSCADRVLSPRVHRVAIPGIPDSTPLFPCLSPYIRLAHDFQTAAGFVLEPRRINDHAFLYFCRGHGEADIAGKRSPLRAGTVLILRPNVPHSFQATGQTTFHMLNLHVDLVERPDSPTIRFHQEPGEQRQLSPKHILPADPRWPGYLPPVMELSRPEVYERLFYRILHSWPQPDLASALRRKAGFSELLAFLYSEHLGLEPAAGGWQEEHFAAVVRFVHEHYSEKLELADMARIAHLGRSHFAELFRKQFGLSPIAYVRRLRIEHAKTELRYQRLPIKAIAERTGFANVHHFTRVFKVMVGVSPARYRGQPGP